MAKTTVLGANKDALLQLVGRACKLPAFVDSLSPSELSWTLSALEQRCVRTVATETYAPQDVAEAAGLTLLADEAQVREMSGFGYENMFLPPTRALAVATARAWAADGYTHIAFIGPCMYPGGVVRPHWVREKSPQLQ